MLCGGDKVDKATVGRALDFVGLSWFTCLINVMQRS